MKDIFQVVSQVAKLSRFFWKSTVSMSDEIVRYLDVIQDFLFIFLYAKSGLFCAKAGKLYPLKPDLLTLYRRPNPIIIWPTYAVPPTTTLYPRSTYDLWRAGSSTTIFRPVEKLIPLTTTSQSGPDQPPLYIYQHTLSPIKARSLPIRPFFQSRRERGLIGSLTNVNGPLCVTSFEEHIFEPDDMKFASPLTLLSLLTRSP